MDIGNLLAQIGTITPPDTIPTAPNPEVFVARFVRASILILLVSGFIIFFIWTMFAGYRFIFSGGDEKGISGAWSQIYWGLIGMLVVVGAFAIIRLVETFFGVDIVSGGLRFPRI